ncbi:hypothetical protein [Eremococcus coleocola]|uniref:Uncharacterized protein n=1 Tax=Eremococcus coleocola ACS-139-V-Col8 TaxID=908337 RepID=E4KM48_9LACT|nr:hypothetical protein [Eremococcus coleocola]EFR32017.1 hypothetical protein HMPREF9257_1034 [Eremococcus coleocola ACS-139-V-Col8]
MIQIRTDASFQADTGQAGLAVLIQAEGKSEQFKFFRGGGF